MQRFHLLKKLSFRFFLSHIYCHYASSERHCYREEHNHRFGEKLHTRSFEKAKKKSRDALKALHNGKLSFVNESFAGDKSPHRVIDDFPLEQTPFNYSKMRTKHNENQRRIRNFPKNFFIRMIDRRVKRTRISHKRK